MIAENCILKKLNLSGNEFSDRDVEILTTALEVKFRIFCFNRLENFNIFNKKNIEKSSFKRIRS